jgi:ribose transport system substrate-binding protein
MGRTSSSSGNSGGNGPRYYLNLVGKTLELLDVFRKTKADLRLTDIAEMARIDKATALRILYTLQRHGWVTRDLRTKKFRLPLGYRNYRIGYAQLSSDELVSQTITRSVTEEAKKYFTELLVFDNHYDVDRAMESASAIIEQKVDFAIEYQIHYRIAPLIAEMFAKAGIPTLAIDIPQPGAIYFGANNYAAGVMAGEVLGKAAHKRWRGRVDRVLLLETLSAGPIPHARMTGTLQGLRKTLSSLDRFRVIRRDAKDVESGGYEATKKFLRGLSSRDRLLIAAVADSCALGALRAVREAGHEQYTTIVGQGFSPDPRVAQELQKSSSPFVATVAYFHQQYGQRILPVILRWLNHERVAPATYMDHALITRENLDRFSQPADLTTSSVDQHAAAAAP